MKVSPGLTCKDTSASLNSARRFNTKPINWPTEIQEFLFLDFIPKIYFYSKILWLKNFLKPQNQPMEDPTHHKFLKLHS